MDTKDFFDALHERTCRAQDVKATYQIEEVGTLTYYVQHPTEDERAYLVDLPQMSCDCPDFTCRMNLQHGLCKHLIACDEKFNGGALLAKCKSTGFTHNHPDDIAERAMVAKFAESMAAFDKDDPYRD